MYYTSILTYFKKKSSVGYVEIYLTFLWIMHNILTNNNPTLQPILPLEHFAKEKGLYHDCFSFRYTTPLKSRCKSN